MYITLIAAIGKNGELGKNNDLIWHFHEDMKFFREQTMGKPMIMGRKTLESLPKLLPGRKHLVLSRQNIDMEGIEVFHSKEELLDYINDSLDEVMVIGGASIYNMFIENADCMLLTEIDEECPIADVYFPKFDKNDWEERVISSNESNHIKYKHIEYKRNKR